MNDRAELDRALSDLAASGAVEVREDGRWLAGLASLHYELRQRGKVLLVHLWSEERNLTRRILKVTEQSEGCLVLEVEHFGRPKPGRLEFLRTDTQRTAERITREQFRERFHRFLAERFPDSIVDSLTASPDLEHSFSGVYVRGRMHEGAREHALIAASPAETAAIIGGILSFGLLWLDWTRAHTHNRPVQGLRVFVPEGTSRSIRERALGLSCNVRLEVYEYNERESRVQKMDSADAGNLESRLVHWQDTEIVLGGSRDAKARLRSLAPLHSELADNVAARIIPGTGEVAFCFRGLEFARWSQEGISFGLTDPRERLTEATQTRLVRLMRDLNGRRCVGGSDVNNPLYRAAPERWLETLIMDAPESLDARLDKEHLYSQIPALAGGDRAVLDLLGVTLRGALVVIELKASEDIQMPMQAVDYWLRVRRHQQSGDFQRNGYFPGLEISADSPLLWLVAPSLRFHPATDTLLKYLAPEIRIARIGLNENWRRGVQVVFRQ